MEGGPPHRISPPGNPRSAASTARLTRDPRRYPKRPTATALGCARCAATPIPILQDRDSTTAAPPARIRRNLECALAYGNLRCCPAACGAGRRTAARGRTCPGFAPGERVSEAAARPEGW